MKKKITVGELGDNLSKYRRHRPITRLGQDGIDEQKQARAKLTKTNKQRAYRMEAKIAKYFGENGFRVPMSGSLAAWKGDIVVELKNNPGKFLVECKLTAAFNNTRLSPQIRLVYGWLEKLQADVTVTHAKWGILVFFYHGTRDYYVIIRTEDLRLLTDRYSSPHRGIIEQMLELAPLDWRVKVKGAPRTGYNIIHSELEASLTQIGLFRAIKFIIPATETLAGEYILMPLSNYRDLIEDI